VAKTKSWDSTLKRLIHVNPDEFVQWLIPNATYLSEQPSELESLQREVDILLQVLVSGQRMLLHIEFQTYNDRDMAERLLLYNVLARNAHKLPVFSCVIYLLRDGIVPQSPFRITFPAGELIHEFRFESIEIGQLTPDDILNMDSVTLLPLLPLTQGGASREVIDRMFVRLKEQRKAETQVTELETIGYTLASFVLQKKSAVDQE
jgi:predicted transposase/invertase (TIGR01784 family)